MVPQRDWFIGVNKKSFGIWLDKCFGEDEFSAEIGKQIEIVESFISALKDQSFNDSRITIMESKLLNKYIKLSEKSTDLKILLGKSAKKIQAYLLDKLD